VERSNLPGNQRNLITAGQPVILEIIVTETQDAGKKIKET
jgi:hypothetical protein